MKPFHCFIAACIGYLVIVFVGALLIALNYLVAFPFELFWLMLAFVVVTTPIVMGMVLGLRWSQPTIAFDEILPTCLVTLIIFGVPLLFASSAIVPYLVLSPIYLFEMRFGMKIGIEMRHYRLWDELLGKWSAGEK